MRVKVVVPPVPPVPPPPSLLFPETKSNASTQIQSECDAGFLVPETSTLKVWLPELRPEMLYITACAWAAAEYASTCAFKTPSMYTLAMPDHASLYPIHRTSVPANVNVARDPLSTANTALPPLLNEPVLEYQNPVYVTA